MRAKLADPGLSPEQRAIIEEVSGIPEAGQQRDRTAEQLLSATRHLAVALVLTGFHYASRGAYDQALTTYTAHSRPAAGEGLLAVAVPRRVRLTRDRG